MDVTDLAGFAAHSERFDQLVEATPDIDLFCSSSDWLLPAVDLDPPETFHAVVDDEAAAVLASHRAADGRHVLTGVDTMWGFAATTVGADPRRSAGLLGDLLDSIGAWDFAVLTGFVADSRLDREVITRLSPTHRLHAGPEMTRQIIDIDSPDEIIDRRSAKFRRNLRRAERAALDVGVEFHGHDIEDRADLERGFERLLAIEAASWKGHEATGLMSEDLAAFYRRIADRLAPQHRLRLRFAVHDGTDIGYILGGVRGGTYRGFQLSYDRSHRDLSIGHLLQLDQLRALEPERLRMYDLGMDMDYKRSWADRSLTTRAIIAIPH